MEKLINEFDAILIPTGQDTRQLIWLKDQLLGAREVTIVYGRSLEHSYTKAEIKRLINNEGVKFVE